MPRDPSKPVSASTLKARKLKLLACTDHHERALHLQGYRHIAGVDEVGRGCLFGPVVAAAVLLPPHALPVLATLGLNDSKQLDEPARVRLDPAIRSLALAVAIAEVDAATIDRVNIYQASRLAMLLAVQQLSTQPDHLLVDAMRLDTPLAQTRLVHGDAISLSIAAASVVAKVYRDNLLHQLDLLHPHYGLARHKGYATPEHRRALLTHGPTPLHRRSFAPVAALCSSATSSPPTQSAVS